MHSRHGYPTALVRRLLDPCQKSTAPRRADEHDPRADQNGERCRVVREVDRAAALDGEAEPNDEAEDREGNQGQRDPSGRGIGAGESGLALGLTTRSSAPGRAAEQSGRAPAAHGRLLVGERTSAVDSAPRHLHRRRWVSLRDRGALPAGRSRALLAPAEMLVIERQRGLSQRGT
jgi:hypothetical protein